MCRHVPALLVGLVALVALQSAAAAHPESMEKYDEEKEETYNEPATDYGNNAPESYAKDYYCRRLLLDHGRKLSPAESKLCAAPIHFQPHQEFQWWIVWMVVVAIYFVAACVYSKQRERSIMETDVDVLHGAQTQNAEKNRINQLLAVQEEHENWIMILSEQYGGVFKEAFFNKATILSVTVWSITTILDCYKIVTFDDSSDLNTALGPVSGFLIFFAVFYGSQCYTRYDAQYNTSMACIGRIYDITTLCLAYLPRQVALQIVRYACATHILAYIGLNNTYPHLNASFFQALVAQQNLLTQEEEAAVLRTGVESGGAAYRETILWMLKCVEANNQTLRAEQIRSIEEQILRLRSALATMYDYNDHPVPFGYWNLLTWIVIFYCPTMAFSVAVTCNNDYRILGGLAMLAFVMSFVGLCTLAKRMAKPYGSDRTDFAVYSYVHGTCKGCRDMFVNSAHNNFIAPPVSGNEEFLVATNEQTHPMSARNHDRGGNGPTPRSRFPGSSI